jgi:hypothetical protein
VCNRFMGDLTRQDCLRARARSFYSRRRCEVERRYHFSGWRGSW